MKCGQPSVVGTKTPATIQLYDTKEGELPDLNGPRPAIFLSGGTWSTGATRRHLAGSPRSSEAEDAVSGGSAAPTPIVSSAIRRSRTHRG